MLSRFLICMSSLYANVLYQNNSNPNVPDQKLKVVIPAKANMETRSFVVSVPAPKVEGQSEEPQPEPKENDFPKELKEALYSYSMTFDDWCDALGEIASVYHSCASVLLLTHVP